MHLPNLILQIRIYLKKKKKKKGAISEELVETDILHNCNVFHCDLSEDKLVNFLTVEKFFLE